ncbi:MAG: long-chain fatty acid--CoA ligase [Alicyclobacillus herbarius]|uniref:long-chain fatty acid--CoA ligase n=1 Tax=Alicyclobacillus herbarius TaxID=122960 RepID=UPI0003F578E7|nr:long-chain fatty acid--CoA ligase [Alicyclobacillus herbarius]MCL6632171.1 long-chain fatty acid--CoA ligase [Alicyclobacillus herbarius]
MMNYPLLLRSVLYRAVTVFPEKEVVSRDYSQVMRYTYADMHRRVCQLAHALEDLGVQPGEHVASFAWNHHRHLELYFAVPCSKRVLHTVNIRLFRDQILYTINHAEDKVLFVDEDLVPLIESIAPQLNTVQHYVVMSDKRGTPKTQLPGAVFYEDLIAGQPDSYEFPEFDEWTPAILGYTSATTGNPKGVVYSHRGLYLHCLTNLVGELGTREYDVTMPIVPMFHVNAWGRPYTDTWIGAKQVYPGSRPTAADLCELIHRERVTFAVGVPTIWMGVLQQIRANPGKYDFSSIRFLMSGGAALPASLTQAFEKELGVRLWQGYGQTETTPVTFVNEPKTSLSHLSEEEKLKLRTKTGLIVPGLEMRIVGEDGREVAHDGKQMGELWLRGPWVLAEYYKDPEQTRNAFVDGWFRTGDIATLDEHGYLQVVDRTKDLIKSGGEWISSVDLENAIMAHPQVDEAAVIGIPDEKWQERPLACVVVHKGAEGKLSKHDILAFLQGKVAKWWLPDEVVFVDEIPKTSVGKFSKKTLRQWYQEGRLGGSGSSQAQETGA